MTIAKTSPSKLAPIIRATIGTLADTEWFEMDTLIGAFCQQHNITEDAWGFMTSQKKPRAWMRFNMTKALKILEKDGYLIRLGRGKFKVAQHYPAEVAVKEEPKLVVVEEPEVEIKEEPKVEDVEVVEAVSFELPKPPEDTSGFDAHMVKTLKDATGCFGYYSPKATACGHCPLAHHCAKELNNVMSSIGRALI
jgi:hypothetical protein